MTPAKPSYRRFYMGEGDLTTFNQQYDTWCSERIPRLGNVNPFNFFCVDQFSKHRNLSYNEITSGLVDGSGDGGVDGFYCYFGNVLLQEDTEVNQRSDGDFEIKIFQMKETEGFSPVEIQKIERFCGDLLSFHREEKDYTHQYREALLKLMRKFKETFNLVIKHNTPRISVEYLYVSRLDIEPATDAEKQAAEFQTSLDKYYSELDVYPVNFIPVRGLWSQWRTPRPRKKRLPISNNLNASGGWVVLVSLQSYCEFLRDATDDINGRPRIDEGIFDSNVRGYNPSSGVNKRITQTLESDAGEFWQLNNGITVISPTPATLADGQLHIDNPQIVNGLQTSRRIFDYYRAHGFNLGSDTRHVLVRVIKTEGDSYRSQIIRATNDQNPMPPEAFLATMRVQQQIEMHFEKNDFYYERRKGHYKSLGKPSHRIVEVLELLQALIAITQRDPETARGGPRTYLKDTKRTKLFGSDDPTEKGAKKPFDMDVYLRSIQIMRRVREYLIMVEPDQRENKNLEGYVALAVAVGLMGNYHFKPKDVSGIDVGLITDEVVKKAYERVYAIYDLLQDELMIDADAVAKGKQMGEKLRDALKEDFPHPDQVKGGNNAEKTTIGISEVRRDDGQTSSGTLFGITKEA
jgi:hypothetical protein